MDVSHPYLYYEGMELFSIEDYCTRNRSSCLRLMNEQTEEFASCGTRQQELTLSNEDDLNAWETLFFFQGTM
jgi:hypothetical protein